MVFRCFEQLWRSLLRTNSGARASLAALASVALLVASSLPTQAASPERYRELIDSRIVARWEREGATPSPLVSDAEFLRRVWLDLAGEAPSAGQVQAFLEDTNPEKRQRVTRELLASSHYVQRFADQWTELLVPEGDSNFQLAFAKEEMRSWLRSQALQGVPYDQLVRSLLMVPLSPNTRSGNVYYSNSVDPKPTAFYAAKDTAPENLAAATSRVFLGIRVDCAQCHDHPFADWTREQFWGYAAFYQGLGRSQGTNFLVDFFLKGATEEVTIGIPETAKRVPAKFLNGESPALRGKRPRDIVADWVVSRDNPYFARAMVNRTWADLLGRGIIDPVDDMDHSNPPSHPELLDELATAFAEDFDVPRLIEGIVMSAPYQRSSVRTDSTQEAPELFARFLPRRLDAAQVERSLQKAFSLTVPPYTPGVVYNNRNEFQAVFRSSAAPLDRTSSVQQMLLLMNGTLAQSAIAPKGTIISAWTQLPGATQEELVEMAYLSILGRLPRDEEMSRMKAHLEASSTLAEGLADISWVLLNSAEFVVNH
ncbi:MAG: DUF1549 domain-containing protein [Planctomycetales bacterium]|nr:DUF1549 domain-containing protein [Planctomycetales bacterium]